MPPPTPLPPVFTYERRTLPNGGILYVVDIKKITPALKAYMDKVLGDIVFGRADMKLPLVKQKIRSFLKKKKDSNQEIGAIAEYFVHLFLCDRKLQPHSLITNLEENSMKKGFDGLYMLNGEEWLCESKSGSLITAGVCHVSKVKEAYNGLKKKVTGIDPNNPWENAMYHSRVLNARKPLIKRLTELSDRFDMGKFGKIEQFNIIPCGTVYIDGKKTAFKVDEIENKVCDAITKFKYKNLRVVCITKDSVKTFYGYLNS
jgi:hypothetical protein